MKNTNKKTIVKFAAFVIIFALICIAVNFAAGQIMNKEFLSARSIFTTAIGSVLFGYFIFFGRKQKRTRKKYSVKSKSVKMLSRFV